jgi:hypothetical protein
MGSTAHRSLRVSNCLCEAVAGERVLGTVSSQGTVHSICTCARRNEPAHQHSACAQAKLSRVLVTNKALPCCAVLFCPAPPAGPGTLYQVTCTTTAATLPVRFNLSLAVTAGATSSCSDASSATTEAYVPCCGGGGDTAYASVGVGGDTTLRTAAGNSACFYATGEDWSSCGNPNGNCEYYEVHDEHVCLTV